MHSHYTFDPPPIYSDDTQGLFIKRSIGARVIYLHSDARRCFEFMPLIFYVDTSEQGGICISPHDCLIATTIIICQGHTYWSGASKSSSFT